MEALVGMNPDDVHPNADVNENGRIGIEEVIYILQELSELR